MKYSTFYFLPSTIKTVKTFLRAWTVQNRCCARHGPCAVVSYSWGTLLGTADELKKSKRSSVKEGDEVRVCKVLRA